LGLREQASANAEHHGAMPIYDRLEGTFVSRVYISFQELPVSCIRGGRAADDSADGAHHIIHLPDRHRL
jgi:hypothetical protein